MYLVLSPQFAQNVSEKQSNKEEFFEYLFENAYLQVDIASNQSNNKRFDALNQFEPQSHGKVAMFRNSKLCNRDCQK